MKTKTFFAAVVMVFVLLQAGIAGETASLQNYLNETACKVKATEDPAQKRAILENSLETMSKALEQLESSGLVSQDDRAGMNSFKTAIQEKQNELMGMNGYERVSDSQLNDFSDYVVQDMQQAERFVTISLVSALLIIIILILIL